MNEFIPNILTKEECKNLVEQFDIEKLNMISADAKWLTGNSFGYGSKNLHFNKYMDILKPRMLEYYHEDTTLQNVNTYVREYFNNSFLNKHIDRTDIGITLTICLELNIKNKWPICAEIEGEDKCFDLNVGDALLMTTAYKTPHWRDVLKCKEDERVVQLFIHWKETEYKSKKTKTIL
jgi:hypothetical protein